MRKVFKYVLSKLSIALFIALIMTVESAVCAWLSTSVNLGEFSIKNYSLKIPKLEMWTCHKNDGWYLTYEDQNTEEKKLQNINKSTITNTFEKNGDYSLYFGTINNLVDQQDNLPVYMKVTVVLPPYSSNTISINYSLPNDNGKHYLKPYRYMGSAAGWKLLGYADSADNLYYQLTQKDVYPFLSLNYYISNQYSANIAPYILSGKKIVKSDTYSKDSSIPDKFDSIFTSDKIVEDGTNLSISDSSISNSDPTEKYVYLYFKFSVPTDTLQSALFNTDLKYVMPIYLVFDIKFDICVESKSIN